MNEVLMGYLAHSMNSEGATQPYEDHVRGVVKRADIYSSEVGQYATQDANLLEHTVHKAAYWHDLGKLDEKNQSALRDESGSRTHLPINHVDAGTSYLKSIGESYPMVAVFSHHRGLPDFSKECVLPIDRQFRDEDPSIRRRVNGEMKQLTMLHEKLVPEECCDDFELASSQVHGDKSVLCRMMLSCLADADHSDTAGFYGETPEDEKMPPLEPQKRLERLDKYISAFSADDKRNMLRREMYFKCRDAAIDGNFISCNSPVGSGKTTAVMAFMLNQCIKRGLRRIIVVLPYTSIIQQSVGVYRKSVVLPGEDPTKVVAEVHSKVDFDDYDTRYLTMLWRAPIIVTTSVAFFETIASNKPSALRRYHELPGSMIFIDEAHNALPITLMPLAWHWMNVLADDWSCAWILASGSLVEYWKLSVLKRWGIQLEDPSISELVPHSLQKSLMQYEKDRVSFCWKKEAADIPELTNWVTGKPGPRLLIVNTVQNAAVIAEKFRLAVGRDAVEHLSTALTPEDREQTIAKIKSRLANDEDTDWTLVATSCVEAGVDISFRTGFREIASLLSLLQTAGRVNRDGHYTESEIWSFSLQDNSQLNRNPRLSYSSDVLLDYLKSGIRINPDLSTQSLNDELLRNDRHKDKSIKIMKDESDGSFESVCKQFKVIDANTVTVVIDHQLAETICMGYSNWQELQRKSVGGLAF